MSSITLNKLKKRFTSTSKLEVIQSHSNIQDFNDSPPSNTSSNIPTTESVRLARELAECDFTYINGKKVPFTNTPILVQTTPASATTMKLINDTLLLANDIFITDTRFIDFFPPPIPPPQFLQPDFVKYKINYEPIPQSRPCVGYRTIEP